VSEDLDPDRERRRQAEADKRLREEAAAAQAAAELEREVFEERRRREAAKRLNAVLDEDFLRARSWVLSSTAHGRPLGAEEFDSLAMDFVREWARSEIEQRLDPEQASAVAHVDGHVQVVARAGSGKTLTLVSRALFLAMHCRPNALDQQRRPKIGHQDGSWDRVAVPGRRLVPASASPKLVVRLKKATSLS
jgi:DNA helicase IV